MTQACLWTHTFLSASRSRTLGGGISGAVRGEVVAWRLGRQGPGVVIGLTNMNTQRIKITKKTA